MEIKVVIKRRKPGQPMEAEARRQRLQSDKLSAEERYIDELMESRSNGQADQHVSGSPQVAKWYAKQTVSQFGMVAWIAGEPPREVPDLTAQQQLRPGGPQYGYFTLYSLEHMESRLQQIMKTLKIGQLFICAAASPITTGIKYIRGYGLVAKVTDVVWTLNRSGDYVPQIIIVPTRIGDKAFNRVTGHSIQFITDNRIGPGSTIRICQAGNSSPVIDAVLSSEDPILPPPLKRSKVKAVHRPAICK
jgi:hypothetical protein